MNEISHCRWIEPFEIEVLLTLTDGILSPGVLDAAIKDGELVSYDYNGYGYYLKFRHPQIPTERIVCSDPMLIGQCDGIEAGFVVFVEGNQLTLECFPFDGTSIPEKFRNQPICIRKG